MLREPRLRCDVDEVAHGVDDAELGHASFSEQHRERRQDAQRVAWSARGYR